ncbi:MAG TPA: DUF3570 domain-containing protein [Kofleriaceae bacterium]
MRLQLAALVLAITAGTARADGEVTIRGVYYKERATRVVQPMLDGMFDAGARGLVTAHLLVDAITSASSGSGANNATPFTEKRYEGGFGYQHEFDGPTDSWLDKLRVAGDTKYSTESDYTSFYLGAHAEADVAQKNATISLGGGISSDSITNAGAQSPMGGPQIQCDNTSVALSNECSLTSYFATATVSQILSKNAILAVGYDLAYLDGYQANPYRTAVAGDALVPEVHPNSRLRQAFSGSLRYYLAPTHTALIGAYRYYRDDWHIRAHTPELRIVQEVGSLADASIRLRYYHQTASYFYKPRYPELDTSIINYVTDDPKMSGYDGYTMEAKLGILGEEFGLSGTWAAARFEGIIEYIIQHNAFGDAVVAHVALTLPFSY